MLVCVAFATWTRVYFPPTDRAWQTSSCRCGHPNTHSRPSLRLPDWVTAKKEDVSMRWTWTARMLQALDSRRCCCVTKAWTWSTTFPEDERHRPSDEWARDISLARYDWVYRIEIVRYSRRCHKATRPVQVKDDNFISQWTTITRRSPSPPSWLVRKVMLELKFWHFIDLFADEFSFLFV